MSEIEATHSEREARMRMMYSRLQYPSLDPAYNERYRRHRTAVYAALGVDVSRFFHGKTVLDAGCGTGEETLFLASLGPERIIGIDTSEGSLNYARERVARFGAENVEFRHVSVLDTQAFADGSFDYVSSLGCIHHTPDFRAAFANLARMVRDGGHLCTFIYNSYGHFLYNIECGVLNRLAGDDVEKRVWWGRRLFDWRLRKEFHREGIPSAYEERLYDKYGVLYRDSVPLAELLGWYRNHGFEHQSSFPMSFGEIVHTAVARDEGEPASSLRGRLACLLSAVLPAAPEDRRWTWRRRTWMQSVLLCMGLYDYGSAFRILAHKTSQGSAPAG